MARLAGRALILDHVRLSFTGDPWGTVNGWIFPLASIVWVEEGELLPGFRPSPMLRKRADLENDWETTALLDLYTHGELTTDHMREAYALLTRAADILRAMGRAY